MGFLAPAFLALTALAAVPILVHLLRRRIGRTVEFPAVRYLERMEQEHSRDIKLKNRLLLLLRILAVLAMALAAARPIARLAGLGHAPVAVALVVDNSMSSGAVVDGRSRLEQLKSDADQLLSELTPADRVWLVTADARVTGGEIDAVRRAVAALAPLGGAGEMDVAVRRAVALARSERSDGAVVAVLTDGQKFMAIADSVVTLGDVPMQVLLPPEATIRSRAVVDVRAEPVRWTPSGTLHMQFASADSAAYRVVIDERTVSRGTAGPGTVALPSHVSVRLGTSANGWLRGRVELDADDLRADDVRHFAVHAASPPSVVIRGDAGPFVAAAVATLADERRIARTGSAPGIVVGTAGSAIPRLPALILAPADPVQVGEANRALARLNVPWRFGAIMRNSVSARVNGAADSAVQGVGAALDGARVLLRYPLMYSAGGAAPDGIDTIATAGGAPWIVAGAGYVIVGSPLDPDATDLPLRAGFLPLLLDWLSFRLGDAGVYANVFPGERLQLPGGALELEAADSALTPLPATGASAPNAPGVYFVRRGAARIGAIVVNAEPEESDVGQQDGAAFIERLNGSRVNVYAAGNDWRKAIFAQAEGRALLIPLLAIALLLLALEAWIARLSSRRDSQASQRVASRAA